MWRREKTVKVRIEYGRVLKVSSHFGMIQRARGSEKKRGGNTVLPGLIQKMT